MTQVVIGDISPYTQATATGGQTVFGTNWTANVASDVVVYQTPSGNAPNDVTQVLSYPSQYSVAFVGGSLQVQVTLVSAASAGDIVTITRQTPADRANLYSNTNFVPSMLNNDFGILTLVDQQAQLVNQLIGPRYNYSAVITDVVDTILPILGASQFWAMNASGTGIVATDIAAAAGSGTVNLGTQNQIAYYASTGTAVSGTSTIPSAVQLNITELGTITTGVWYGTPMGLAYGGTNANLTAANGAVPYSTASALALLAPGSSGQLFQSGGAGAPNWTTATYPTTAGTAGNRLQSDGTNIASVASNYVLSGSCGAFHGGAGTGPTLITNMTCTITATGRPIMIAMIPDGSANACGVNSDVTGSGQIYFYKGGVSIAKFETPGAGINGGQGFMSIDAAPTPGSTIYQAYYSNANNNLNILYYKLIVIEL